MGQSDFEIEYEERRHKRLIRAPCVYTKWNEAQQREAELYPAVFCSHECDKCGWNPKVAAARITRLKERLNIGGAE